MSAHERTLGATDEWYTPPYVFEAMGVRFDLDVAHPGQHRVGWIPAPRVLVANSLDLPWSGFVWMNPPFGGRGALAPWLAKFMTHGDGVALTPDRTSAPWWQEFAPMADQILFVREKIKFIRPDGSLGKQPGTGTTLLAKGARGVRALENARRAGLGLVLTQAQPSRTPQVHHEFREAK
ncbi:DNA N-6-adenine-methyltransferase [Phenylobacterium sp.]|uniref:DNA N-6-adenine-methyltransferase n=1 Tax=Phenylobacterium sp. TaxID=1871053 RepID=UPI002717EA17|nr:DNA N-6-adenine-methyltransferase [Phenylobacterium sp.]MDO8800101.1 DNA N-6-adenine-methyltransferase [Phenylobacterium sp.]